MRKASVLFLFPLAIAFAGYPVQKLPTEELVGMCFDAGRAYNVKPRAIYAISDIESGGNIYAYNPANKNRTADMGLMQINSYWLPDLKKYGLYDLTRIYDPEYNIHVGAWILRQCIDRFGRSWKSIDCYNKGPRKAQDHGSYVNKFRVAYESAPSMLGQ